MSKSNARGSDDETRIIDGPTPDNQVPPRYFGYAMQWTAYERWTVIEAANLLAGCLPHRELFQAGTHNQKLDDRVVAIENRINKDLGGGVRVIKAQRYFGKTYIDSRSILDWTTDAALPMPAELKLAFEKRSPGFHSSYTNPSLKAMNWAVMRFWEQAAEIPAPSAAVIVNATLKRFPNLTLNQARMIEKLIRDPASGTPKPDADETATAN